MVLLRQTCGREEASELLRQIKEGCDPGRIRHARSASISEYVEAFELSLRAKECSDGPIDSLVARLNKVFSGCSVNTLAEVNASGIEQWLARQQVERALAAQTRKHYVVHLRQFGTFLVRQELVPKNPFFRSDRH